MFKIKASSAPFGFSGNNTNFYFTNKDAELSQILEELLNCITDISHFVEQCPIWKNTNHGFCFHG